MKTWEASWLLSVAFQIAFSHVKSPDLNILYRSTNSAKLGSIRFSLRKWQSRTERKPQISRSFSPFRKTWFIQTFWTITVSYGCTHSAKLGTIHGVPTVFYRASSFRSPQFMCLPLRSVREASFNDGRKLQSKEEIDQRLFLSICCGFWTTDERRWSNSTDGWYCNNKQRAERFRKRKWTTTRTRMMVSDEIEENPHFCWWVAHQNTRIFT